MSILDDIRFWAKTTEDSSRTIICQPGLAEQVRAKLDELGVAGIHHVVESPHTPAGQLLLVDHNAIDASTRQAIQRMGKGPVFR